MPFKPNRKPKHQTSDLSSPLHSAIIMGEGTTSLPPGFRFFPSDEELVINFLHRKASLLPCRPDIIPTLDLHHCDPWDLDGKALQGGNQWYFFARSTQNRSTANGYWNSVGTDEPVTSGNKEVGMKRTLVFYIGEVPEGIKTNWVMHEYHLPDTSSSSSSSARRSYKKRGNPRVGHNKWVICRVYDASCDGGCFHEDRTELSCLDEVFLSFDDLDEVSLPN